METSQLDKRTIVFQKINLQSKQTMDSLSQGMITTSRGDSKNSIKRENPKLSNKALISNKNMKNKDRSKNNSNNQKNDQLLRNQIISNYAEASRNSSFYNKSYNINPNSQSERNMTTGFYSNSYVSKIKISLDKTRKLNDKLIEPKKDNSSRIQSRLIFPDFNRTLTSSYSDIVMKTHKTNNYPSINKLKKLQHERHYLKIKIDQGKVTNSNIKNIYLKNDQEAKNEEENELIYTQEPLYTEVSNYQLNENVSENNFIKKSENNEEKERKFQVFKQKYLAEKNKVLIRDVNNDNNGLSGVSQNQLNMIKEKIKEQNGRLGNLNEINE